MKVAVSGYFAPLHSGHIDYFKKASKLGKLIVIVNNDNQLYLKKKIKYPIKDRISVIKELKCVDKVIVSIDNNRCVCKTLEMIKPDIFANGGDRNVGNIPEKEVCDKLNIKIIDGLGEKIQSSTNLLNND